MESFLSQLLPSGFAKKIMQWILELVLVPVTKCPNYPISPFLPVAGMTFAVTVLGYRDHCESFIWRPVIYISKGHWNHNVLKLGIHIYSMTTLHGNYQSMLDTDQKHHNKRALMFCNTSNSKVANENVYQTVYINHFKTN